MTPNNFGKKLLSARKQAKLSRRKLSELTGLSQSLIQAYEEGTHDPSLHRAQLLAKFLGFDL